jgi:hypothetical protein
MLDGTIASAELLAALARQHTARAIARLAEVMNGDDPQAAVDAARELLSRGYGAPLLSLCIDGVHIELDTGAEPDAPHRPNGEGRAWNAC